MNLKVQIAVVAMSALCLTACGSAELGPANQQADRPGETRDMGNTTSQSASVVTGILTDEGVVCQAMRGEDGELYTIESFPEGPQIGDTVRVTRDADGQRLMSVCDQGTVLTWSKIVQISAGGQVVQSWEK